MSRELKVMLRREPETVSDLDVSNWSLENIDAGFVFSPSWYIEVFP